MNDTMGSQEKGCSAKAGLTLIELMAVIFIAALLGAIVLGISGHAARKSSEARARADLELLRNALQEYRLEQGAYPAEDIEALSDWEPYGPPFSNRVEQVFFVDPWGVPYQYRSEGRYSFDLWSWGPSGGPGNVEDGEDYEYDIIR